MAQDLGPLVFHAAAKDVRINPAAAVYGVLDNRFRRLGPDEPRTNLGGDEWANEWPKDAAWDFVALGRGHDAVYWSTWLAALHVVDPDMLVNIEHEDVSTRPHRGAGDCLRGTARCRPAGRSRQFLSCLLSSTAHFASITWTRIICRRCQDQVIDAKSRPASRRHEVELGQGDHHD